MSGDRQTQISDLLRRTMSEFIFMITIHWRLKFNWPHHACFKMYTRHLQAPTASAKKVSVGVAWRPPPPKGPVCNLWGLAGRRLNCSGLRAWYLYLMRTEQLLVRQDEKCHHQPSFSSWIAFIAIKLLCTRRGKVWHLSFPLYTLIIISGWCADTSRVSGCKRGHKKYSAMLGK